MIKKREKHAQSQVVGTVLLILITVVAAGLIMAFVVPFIKEKLPDSDQNCFDIVSKVKIRSAYTCYGVANKNQSVQIHIDDIRDSIKGFTIELGGPSSRAVKALEDNNSGVRMYGGGTFELPNNNEERTYNISAGVRPTYVSVYPVLKNSKICEASDSLAEIENC